MAERARVGQVSEERMRIARAILVETSATFCCAWVSDGVLDLIIARLAAVLPDLALDPQVIAPGPFSDLHGAASALVRLYPDRARSIAAWREFSDTQRHLGAALQRVFAARLDTAAERYRAAGGVL